MVLKYDVRASAEAALALGRPIKLKRGQCAVSFSQHNAAEVEDMQDSKINAVLALMTKKYGDPIDAAHIYKGFLGRLRDRIGVVVRFMNTTTPKQKMRPTSAAQQNPNLKLPINYVLVCTLQSPFLFR